MTCIAGLIRDGRVWLIGDQLHSRSETCGYYFKEPKVWVDDRGGAAWVLGYTGVHHIGQILRYHAPPLECAADPLRYLNCTWIPELRNSLRDHGEMGRHSKDGTDIMDAKVIVGTGDRMFVIDAAFAVGEPDEPFVAVGSGELPAFGALFALHRSAGSSMDAMGMLQIAAAAAERICPSVGGKVTIVHT